MDWYMFMEDAHLTFGYIENKFKSYIDINNNNDNNNKIQMRTLREGHLTQRLDQS